MAPVHYEERGRSFEIKYYIRAAKRRAFYFLIPFLVVASKGVAITLIQKPIYLSEGKLLVEFKKFRLTWFVQRLLIWPDNAYRSFNKGS